MAFNELATKDEANQKEKSDQLPDTLSEFIKIVSGGNPRAFRPWEEPPIGHYP